MPAATASFRARFGGAGIPPTDALPPELGPDPADAWRRYQRLTDPQIALRVADALLAAGTPAEALACLRLSLDLHGDRTEVWRRIAACNRALGDEAAAAEADARA